MNVAATASVTTAAEFAARRLRRAAHLHGVNPEPTEPASAVLPLPVPRRVCTELRPLLLAA